MGQTSLRKFKQGEIIFSAGEIGDCAYIIDSGRVQIYADNSGTDVLINTLGSGEIFGEMAILDRAPRSATAKALEDCLVSVVSRMQFDQRMDQADPIVRLLVAILLKRIRTDIHFASHSGLTELEKEVERQKQFDLEINQNQILEKIKFEAELYEAINHQEFVLYFQPIVQVSTNKIMGFEALIRWQSEKRGMVRPDLFMGVAEETSLIIPIGRWVFEKACECLQGFQKFLNEKNHPSKNFFVTVNISGKQFADTNFFPLLETVPAKYDVAQQNIKLEITEKIILEGTIFFYWIEKCRTMGYPVSLDDFGTGYSMLSYLSDFNVDNIKIDQSFIRKMEQDHKTRVVVQAIINIAKGLGIEVVAEGVETEKQGRILRELGCDYLQGYYFGRPMPFADALKALEKDIASS